MMNKKLSKGLTNSIKIMRFCCCNQRLAHLEVAAPKYLDTPLHYRREQKSDLVKG